MVGAAKTLGADEMQRRRGDRKHLPQSIHGVVRYGATTSLCCLPLSGRSDHPRESNPALTTAADLGPPSLGASIPLNLLNLFSSALNILLKGATRNPSSTTRH